MEVGTKGCAFAEGWFGACSVQECDNVLCFQDVGAVARNDWVAAAENGVSIT